MHLPQEWTAVHTSIWPMQGHHMQEWPSSGERTREAVIWNAGVTRGPRSNMGWVASVTEENNIGFYY